MHQDDYDAFKGTLKQLSEAFSKKLSNELIEGYWKALKDLPLSTVTRMADSHARYAKFFPKPSELRPKDALPERKPDPGFEAAVSLSIKNWNRRLAEDPIGARWALIDAYLARIDVAYPEGSEPWNENMALCRRETQRLIDECGMAYAGADLHRRQVVCQMLGGQAMMDCIYAYKQQSTELAA